MSQPILNVSPELFFETANAHQRSAALKTAIELELFTNIGEGATAQEIARRCDASDRGIRILCDYLTIIGFLEKNEDTYRLTPDTQFFLTKSSPAYIGKAVEFLNSSHMQEGFRMLTEAVRKGGTAVPEEGSLAPEHPMWITFGQAMAPLTTLPANKMAELVGYEKGAPIRVLDIAAGHGMFGITFARHFPNAQIYAVDWPNVLELAKSNAEKAGVSGRYHTLPGSAFDVEFGIDYDVALITNFLHHFDASTCVRFLKRVFSSLKPDGKTLTLEMIPNDDRVTPKLAAGFSLIMLANTPAGDAYTFRELEEMHLDAGFSRCAVHAVPPTIQSVLLCEK
jgi:ubiquinone/menaquinone biosynthesis C-methylase UbiE